MAVGTIKNEGDLARFVSEALKPIRVVIQQLQGGVLSGAGSPEGVVVAPVSTLYRRRDGGAGTSLYVKESGAGNTGWVGK